MRRTLLPLFLAAFALVTACGGSSDSTAPQISVEGTYNLQSVNGSALPYTFVGNGVSISLISEVITASGGSFTQLQTADVTQNGATQRTTASDAGRYTINGSAVTFQFNSDGSTGTGTINGNTFTVANQGYSYYYVKQ